LDGPAVYFHLYDEDDGVPAHVTIDQVAYNDEAPQESPCNTPPQFRDITCLKAGEMCADVAKYNAGRAVARLTEFFVNGNGQQMVNNQDCTGFLITQGARKDLLLTAKHCITES